MMSWLWAPPTPPPAPVALPTVDACDGHLFLPWPSDTIGVEYAAPPPCDWWNGSVQFTSVMCSHFALTRSLPTIVERATQRASQCAISAETECVLAPEAGVALPAAFVYDERTSTMRMLTAPKLLASAGTAQVLLQHPSTLAQLPRQYNQSIEIEYLPSGKRTATVERLENSSAYCVQLLREAFAPSCWQALD